MSWTQAMPPERENTSTFRFAVVRYVPNVVRDEGVNVGVIVQQEDPPKFQFKFLPRSATVRKLWPEADQRLVTHFKEQLTFEKSGKESSLRYLAYPSDPSFFSRAREEFNGNLQLTSPRGMLGADLKWVTDALYRIYVAEPPGGPRPINYQAIAPHRTRERLWVAFERRGLIRPGKLVKKFVLKGEHAPWTFDLGYHNGALNVINSVALNASTTETNLGRALVLKGMIEDVRMTRHDVRGRAVIEPPKNIRSSSGFESARSIIEDAQIEIFTLQELPALVDKIDAELPQ
jgi:hypothetical protein